MNEISVAAPEIAASEQRGIPAADDSKLWEALRLDAERVAAREEMLRDVLDLVVLRHDSFASGARSTVGAQARRVFDAGRTAGRNCARGDGRRSGDHRRGDRRRVCRSIGFRCSTG